MIRSKKLIENVQSGDLDALRKSAEGTKESGKLLNEKYKAMGRLAESNEKHFIDGVLKPDTVKEQWEHLKPRHKLQTIAFGAAAASIMLGTIFTLAQRVSDRHRDDPQDTGKDIPPLSGKKTDIATALASIAAGAYASKTYMEEKVNRILGRARKHSAIKRANAVDAPIRRRTKRKTTL